MVINLDRLELELSEFSHRSSNSNSPRTMMKILRKDLPTLSNDSDSFPKWMMKKAKVNSQKRMTNDRAVFENPLCDRVVHDTKTATLELSFY